MFFSVYFRFICFSHFSIVVHRLHFELTSFLFSLSFTPSPLFLPSMPLRLALYHSHSHSPSFSFSFFLHLFISSFHGTFILPLITVFLLSFVHFSSSPLLCFIHYLFSFSLSFFAFYILFSVYFFLLNFFFRSNFLFFFFPLFLSFFHSPLRLPSTSPPSFLLFLASFFFHLCLHIFSSFIFCFLFL